MQNVSSSNSQAVNVPKLRFPGFEGEWYVSSFNEIFDFLSNNTLSRAELTHEGEVENIHYGDILTKFGDVVDCTKEELPYIADKAKLGSKTSYLQNGDVIIADTAEDDTVGKATEIFNIQTPVVSGLHTMACRPRLNFESRFLGYYINSACYHNQLYPFMQGVKVTSISKGNIALTKIRYPANKEQQKIASMIALLDDRIKKQQQLIDSLKLYKRGAFLELYRKSQKNKYTFSDIYETASEGGTPSTSIAEYYEKGDIPFIKIDDLSGRYVTTAKNFITQRGLEKSSAWLIPANSLIFSNGATIGACSINKIPIATKQGILGIVPKDNISVSFLYYYMTSSIFMKKIKAITTKGTMDCAYLKDISTIHIELPDFNTQIQIAEILDALSSHVEKQEGILSNLLKSKQALLQQMFI